MPESRETPCVCVCVSKWMRKSHLIYSVLFKYNYITYNFSV